MALPVLLRCRTGSSRCLRCLAVNLRETKDDLFCSGGTKPAEFSSSLCTNEVIAASRWTLLGQADARVLTDEALETMKAAACLAPVSTQLSARFIHNTNRTHRPIQAPTLRSPRVIANTSFFPKFYTKPIILRSRPFRAKLNTSFSIPPNGEPVPAFACIRTPSSP